jgi:hypothetical protein
MTDKVEGEEKRIYILLLVCRGPAEAGLLGIALPPIIPPPPLLLSS